MLESPRSLPSFAFETAVANDQPAENVDRSAKDVPGAGWWAFVHQGTRTERLDALRPPEPDLTHMHRVVAARELAASLNHEIREPVAAAALHAEACARWLGRDAPDLTEARNAAAAMVNDLMRAADIIERVGSLYAELGDD